MDLIPIWSIETYDSFIIPKFAKIAYEGILPYVEHFLCSPHPYRKDLVCPFVPTALKNGRLFFTFFDPETSINFEKNAETFITHCNDFYLGSISKSKSFGALIILFKKEFNIQKILEIHLLTKKSCIDKSLMIGALWKTNSATSLHHDKYFPLRTPTPILVIRDLTISDLIFLDPKYYNIKMRISFLNSFIKTFGDLKSNKPQVKEAIKMKKKYQQNKRKWVFFTSLGSFIILTLGYYFL